MSLRRSGRATKSTTTWCDDDEDEDEYLPPGEPMVPSKAKTVKRGAAALPSRSSDDEEAIDVIQEDAEEVSVEHSAATADREDKILQLKKRLVWSICHILAPRPYDEDDEESAEAATVDDGMRIVIDTEDSSSSGAKPVNRISEAVRALQNQKRENEMLRELEKALARIREARPQYALADAVLSGTNARAAEQQRFVCKRCGNREPEFIFTDAHSGDSICRGPQGSNDCGEVVQDHLIFTGEAHRNFEDQDDRNHHGKIADPLMPDSVNMRTCIGAFNDGKFKYRKLQQLAQQTEMDLSNIGKEGRASTRMGYKTEHKLKAFRMMADLALSLRIHDLVVERAKTEFAKYREVKESVVAFEATVLACIVLAFHDLSLEMNLDMKQPEKMSMRDLGPPMTYSELMLVNAKLDDPALSSLRDKPIREFGLEEVRQWLEAVGSEKFASAAKCLAAFMEKVFSGEESLSTLPRPTNDKDSSDKEREREKEKEKEREREREKKRKALPVHIFLPVGGKSNAQVAASLKKAPGSEKGPHTLVALEPRLSAVLSASLPQAPSQPPAKRGRTDEQGVAGGSSEKSDAADDSTAEDHFRRAILRRARFDAINKTAKLLEANEARRKAVEKADKSQVVPVRMSAQMENDERDEAGDAAARLNLSRARSVVSSESKVPDKDEEKNQEVANAGAAGSSAQQDQASSAEAQAEIDIDDLFGGAIKTAGFHFGRAAHGLGSDQGARLGLARPVSSSTAASAAAAAAAAAAGVTAAAVAASAASAMAATVSTMEIKREAGTSFKFVVS